MKLNRRQLLSTAVTVSAALSAPAVLGQSRPRVVVVGGGAGGATAARYIARDSKGSIDVTLIDSSKAYYSCFFSNLYIGGFRDFDSIGHSYGALASAYGINVVHDWAVGVDPNARTVALAGGGSISIEETRAAVVIDVDGGGRKDALALNLEAAETIAREVRLRGLGGLVLIDFVDLDRAAERRRVDRRLADGFAGDPAARRHLPFSPLGVVEMTRQRLGVPLAEQWAKRRR